MAIYRGPGGAGDATNNATSQAILAAQSAIAAANSEAAAAASAVSASNSASSASTSATNAATSATNAAASATNAANSATSAASSATAAQTAKTAAETAETNAELAEVNAEAAESSAQAAKDAAITAQGLAQAAETGAVAAKNAAQLSATNAAISEANAAISESDAASSATAAASSASAASTSATNAANSASTASTAATTATTQASNAATSATAAATSASNAATSATNAANSATSASTSASTATTQATNAANSATSASSSASSAATSATNAANSATLAAGYAASINPSSFATAAQGTKADSALQPAAIGVSVQAYDSDLATIAASNAGSQIASYGQYGVGFKNRIINGAMMIDQRNAGASLSANNNYSVDRWACSTTQTNKFTAQQNAGSVSAPVGFIKYLGITSSSAYSVLSTDQFSLQHFVEGLNCADLGWGTANAATVTLSFLVRSSLTGTFGGCLRNSANDRSYPFSYTINAANTWEQKSITITGDTTGTWLTTNGRGIAVAFSLGCGSTLTNTAGSWYAGDYRAPTGATSVVGTNGATFYITGVQLEKGSTATPFEYRPYGQELALCQRYYYKSAPSTNNGYFGSAQVYNSTGSTVFVQFPAQMRIRPTSLEQTGTASNYKMVQANTATSICTSVPTFGGNTSESVGVVVFTSSSFVGTAGQASAGATDGSGYLAWSAEL